MLASNLHLTYIKVMIKTNHITTSETMTEYKDTELSPTNHTKKLGWTGRKKRDWFKNGEKNYTEYMYYSDNGSKVYKTVWH